MTNHFSVCVWKLREEVIEPLMDLAGGDLDSMQSVLIILMCRYDFHLPRTGYTTN